MNDLNHALEPQHTVAKVDILSKYNSNNDQKLRNCLRAKRATFTKKMMYFAPKLTFLNQIFSFAAVCKKILFSGDGDHTKHCLRYTLFFGLT